jgi:prolipoprotein diacylglyceryltransferase
MEFTLLAAAAVAVGGFWLMLRWEAKRGNAAGCSLDLWDAGLTAAAIGLLIGRLIAMMQVGINPLADAAQIILVRSGVSTAGASIAALLKVAVLARKARVEAADANGPAALGGLAGWHAGSIVTGSWLGTVSDLPWAQAASGSANTRHPTEIYAALLFLLAAIAIAQWKQRGRPPLGAPSGLSLAAAGAVMLVTEQLRISLAGGPLWLYAGAIIAGLAVILWSVLRVNSQESGDLGPTS